MRIILELSKEIEKRLHTIRQRMEITDDVEVIARALSLYEFLTDAVTEGKKVLVVDENGVSEEVDVE